MYQKSIHQYIQAHRDEIVRELKELVEIPSVRGENLPGAPFGEACAEALKHVRDLYAKQGLRTELCEEGGYLLSYLGEGEKSIGLFAHADVVPAGDGWIYTTPFEPLEKDGFLIGRGVGDNKAGVIISLYVTKLFQELKLPLNSRLVLYTGSNEESGMKDMESYLSAHTPPDFSLVPDTGFPLYRGDKGILRFYAKSNCELQTVTDFGGGEAFNVVLGRAMAKLCDSEGIILSATGISRHAAIPEGSLNAGYLLADALSAREDQPEQEREQFRLVADMLCPIYGEFFGIENEDSEFGKLTCVNGIIKVEDKRLVLSFDVRYGTSVEPSALVDKIMSVLNSKGWEYIPQYSSPAFVVPADHKYVTGLLQVYSQFTGVVNPVSYINAGATYAKHLPLALETGTQIGHTMPFPMPDGHGGAHQPDECISIDGLLEAIELTALMILRCDDEVNL